MSALSSQDPTPRESAAERCVHPDRMTSRDSGLAAVAREPFPNPTIRTQPMKENPMPYVVMVATTQAGGDDPPFDFDAYVVDMQVNRDEQSEVLLTKDPEEARRFATHEEAEAFTQMSYGTNADGTPNMPLRVYPLLITPVSEPVTDRPDGYA